MFTQHLKVKFSAVALVSLFLISSCSSDSKDTMPAVKDNSASTNETTTKPDSAVILRTGDSATTTKATASESTNATAENHVVTIENMKFNPITITVNKGDKVTFINKDIVAHNATETKNAWASPLLQNGQSWTFTPEKTSDYYCTVHVVMKGKIIVK